jgi:exodeoxyribonuclease VII small subunit
MKTFEERLVRLEQINLQLKSSQTPLSQAMTLFEEGVKLASSLEKELDKMERRVEILMNDPTTPSENTSEASFDLFSDLPKD